MHDWKRNALALGMAAVVMIPGAAYGQSTTDRAENMVCGTLTLEQQMEQLTTYWQLLQEDHTYCGDLDLDFIFGNNGWKPEQKPESGGNEGSGNVENTSQIAREMLAQVNAERRRAGLDELTLSAELSRVATVKAEDMRDRGYFSHTSPTYGSPFDMMKEFGISYTRAGENIAKGYDSVEKVMDGWMNSQGHRANILSSDFTQLGVGYCEDESGQGYWVQMFIRP